jgi:molybdopterin converting factor subunit 1
MSGSIKVNVKLFAILREKAGASDIAVTLPEGASAQMAVDEVIKQSPTLEKFAQKSALAINRQYARAVDPLHDGDELALIPPVSGGST